MRNSTLSFSFNSVNLQESKCDHSSTTASQYLIIFVSFTFPLSFNFSLCSLICSFFYALNKIVRRWGSSLRSNPLPFYIPLFGRKGTPLTVEHCIPFNYCKYTVFNIWISIGNSMIYSDIWRKYPEWYFKIVIRNFTSR